MKLYKFVLPNNESSVHIHNFSSFIHVLFLSLQVNFIHSRHGHGLDQKIYDEYIGNE